MKQIYQEYPTADVVRCSQTRKAYVAVAEFYGRNLHQVSCTAEGRAAILHMISYEPFFDTLKRKHITTYYLINHYGFSKGTLDSLKQGRNINISTLDYLCQLLECKPEDIIRYTPENSKTAPDQE